jgi:hypothetical protein
VPGHDPAAQSVEAICLSQERQSGQSTPSTHRCQSCQPAGGVPRFPLGRFSVTRPPHTGSSRRHRYPVPRPEPSAVFRHPAGLNHPSRVVRTPANGGSHQGRGHVTRPGRAESAEPEVAEIRAQEEVRTQDDRARDEPGWGMTGSGRRWRRRRSSRRRLAASARPGAPSTGAPRS